MEDAKQVLKEIFSENLKYYLAVCKKSQTDLCNDLGFMSSTVSDWITAKKYPRMDKVQMIADYFGIKKSDLTDKKNRNDEIPEIHVINRAAKKMDQAKRDRMMTILRASFMEEFDED